MRWPGLCVGRDSDGPNVNVDYSLAAAWDGTPGRTVIHHGWSGKESLGCGSAKALA